MSKALAKRQAFNRIFRCNFPTSKYMNNKKTIKNETAAVQFDIMSIHVFCIRPSTGDTPKTMLTAHIKAVMQCGADLTTEYAGWTDALSFLS